MFVVQIGINFIQLETFLNILLKMFGILKKLHGDIHTTIETSGYARSDVFQKIASICDFVIMDIKFISEKLHKKYTGCSNKSILINAKWLMNSSIPHLFRTPLIPGITDTEDNLRAISDFIGEERIELLKYNTLAPAKYASVGRVFNLNISYEETKIPNISFFKNATIRK